MAAATKNKPALWKRIVAQVKSENTAGTGSGRWSARKAQLAVARYKKAGGGYKGRKSGKNSLSKWTRQKWRTSDGSPSRSRGKATKRYLPDKAWKSMSASEKRSANRSKAAGDRKGKAVVSLPKKLKKKVARHRK